MTETEKVVYDLILPLVEDKDSVSVKTMPSLEDNEELIYVYAKPEDIARLIGRQGNMATAIRQVTSIVSRMKNKRVSVKFESY